MNFDFEMIGMVSDFGGAVSALISAATFVLFLVNFRSAARARARAAERVTFALRTPDGVLHMTAVFGCRAELNRPEVLGRAALAMKVPGARMSVAFFSSTAFLDAVEEIKSSDELLLVIEVTDAELAQFATL